MRFFARLAITVVLCGTLPAAALAHPLLEGKEMDRDECRLTHHLSLVKFHSRDYSMSGPIKPAAESPLQFALQVVEEDISGGDALVATADHFTDEARQSGARHLFWEIRPRARKRIVVLVDRFNWQGDIHSAYVLDSDVSPRELIADLVHPRAERRFKPLIADSWTPPQVVIDRKTDKRWLLVQGSSFYAMSGWTIYAAGAGDFSQPCTVRFMPPVEEAVNLLPRPAQRFAALLSEALGPGTGEGTLRPTARIRAGVESNWGTAILRPWALRDSYNLRAEVDENLQQWAAANPKRRAVHRALMREYPRAERVLAAHYRSHFRLSSRRAAEMARYATNLLFCSYFNFPSSAGLQERQERKPQVNPWPQ
jgi:hypothetical protein